MYRFFQLCSIFKFYCIWFLAIVALVSSFFTYSFKTVSVFFSTLLRECPIKKFINNYLRNVFPIFPFGALIFLIQRLVLYLFMYIFYWCDLLNPREMASRALAAGSSQAFMIDCDGKPWVWGKLNWGEVEPTQFPTDCTFHSVYCGINTGFLIDMDSQLWKYGAAPTQIYQKMELPPIKAVATYSEFSLFLDTESNVWVLGSNCFGQLGLGTDYKSINCEIPRKIENLPTITAVAAGHSHALFLGNCNAVWSCGSNSCGELGIGSNENLLTPAKIAYLPPIGGLCAGFGVSYFLDLEGNVWSCGENTSGQQGSANKSKRKIETKQNKLRFHKQTFLLPV